MKTRQILIADCLRLLDQGLALLASLDDALYAKPEAAVSSSAIGSHLRHCIDFYELFLEGLSDGRIDYDLRRRDERVERSTGYARWKIADLQTSLRDLRGRALPRRLEVKQDSAGADGREPWAASSVERELQTLGSHTVHHFALIGVILRLNGHEPPEGLGVAPSTLRYWKETGLVHGELDSGR